MGYDVLDLAFRILFLGLIPVLAVTSIASVLIAIVQTATSIKEPALAYSIRLISFVGSLYLVLPSTVEMLLEMMQMVLT